MVPRAVARLMVSWVERQCPEPALEALTVGIRGDVRLLGGRQELVLGFEAHDLKICNHGFHHVALQLLRRMRVKAMPEIAERVGIRADVP